MLARIAKNWRFKMAVQKAIGLLPAELAFPLNDWLVRLSSGSVDSRIDTIRRANKCIDNLGFLREWGEFGPETLDTVLEMGTGWHAIDPIVFHLLGAKRIVTVDHWRHLTGGVVREQIEWMNIHFSELDLDGWVDRDVAHRRLTALREVGKGSDLDGLLERMNCRYVIVPSSRLDRIGLGPEEVSFFYSESVLQRVPTRDLEVSLNYLGRHLLKLGGVFFIRTDQKDIHAQEHVDTSRWPFEFLKYSDRTFALMSSEKLNFQNRLRESDFVTMLEAAGLEVLRVGSSVKDEDVARMDRFNVYSRFEGYATRDLVTSASRFVGQKPNSPRPR